MKKHASHKETNDKLITKYTGKSNLDAIYEVPNYHPIFPFDCLQIFS